MPPVEDCLPTLMPTSMETCVSTTPLVSPGDGECLMMDKSRLLSSWVKQRDTITWTKAYSGWRPVKQTRRSAAAEKRLLSSESLKSAKSKDVCDMKTLEEALSFPATKVVQSGQFRSSITNIDYFLNRSLSELIQHCLGCGDLDPSGEEVEVDPLDLPPLHQECAQPSPSLEQIRTLIHDGCDPNQILPASQGGRSPLHTLLLTVHEDDFYSASLIPAVVALVEGGCRLDLRDGTGSTPLNCLQSLLRQGRVAETARVAELLLSWSHESGSRRRRDNNTGSGSAHATSTCDVNAVDGSGRTLLSHAVTYLDGAAEVTRVLVNHGGRVWPSPAPSSPASVEDLAKDREQSAFTWFLRSLIQTNTLAGAESTLNCISHEMGRDPGRMKSHVTRVMLSEGKHPKVLGPLYLKLKLAMCPFWDEPQHLRYLAWNSIRRSIGPKRLTASTKQLGLPLSLRKYLTLSSTKPPRK